MTQLQTISASKLKTYRTCARQYKYKYVLAKKDRPASTDDKNIGILLGSALHSAIEQYYTQSTNPVLVFQQVMHNTLEEWESKGFTINGLEWFSKAFKEGTAIIRGFKWEDFDPIALEQEFILPFPNKSAPIVLINGFIDMITSDGRVIDHKSQRRALLQDQLDHDSQFIIYAWAYQQLYGDLPTAVIWNHLRTNKYIIADVLTDFDFKISQLSEDIVALLGAKYYVRRPLDNVCKNECSFYKSCYGGD